MGWPSFVRTRHVLNGAKLSEWMKMSKWDERKKKVVFFETAGC